MLSELLITSTNTQSSMQTGRVNLVGFNLPPLLLLHLPAVLLPVKPVRLEEAGHTLIDSRLHSLEAAHVHVCVRLFEELVDLLSVFLHAVLNVHLVSVLIGLLAGDTPVNLEVVGSLVCKFLKFLLVKKGGRGRHSKEQPHETVELVVGVVLCESPANEPTEGCDSGAGSQHDNRGIRIGRHQHGSSHGSGDLDLVSRCQIADVVGADALDLIAVLVSIYQSLHAERHGLGIPEIAERS
mmetsp:Transcript_28987/g.112739  ORF Transcript_28987/g.112739 Transcript_28987/m.112739 type:complete len:239 (-) Transcript_28987:527-1243(-)